MEVRDDLYQTVGLTLRATGEKLAAYEGYIAELEEELNQYRAHDQGLQLAQKMAETGAIEPDYGIVQEKAAEFADLSPEELDVYHKAAELYGGVPPQDGFVKIAAADELGGRGGLFSEEDSNQDALAAFRSDMGWA